MDDCRCPEGCQLTRSRSHLAIRYQRNDNELQSRERRGGGADDHVEGFPDAQCFVANHVEELICRGFLSPGRRTLTDGRCPFVWNEIRQEEPLLLTERGDTRLRDLVEDAIELLAVHLVHA